MSAESPVCLENFGIPQTLTTHRAVLREPWPPGLRSYTLARVGESNSIPKRRVATLSDRFWISLLGAGILSLWYRLPLFGPELSWAHTKHLGLAAKFAALGTEASWVAEWLLVAFAFFWFQAALRRLEESRFRLTRPLLGVVLSVVIVALFASIAAGLNVRAVFVPVALGALWVTASFRFGAGLVTVLASLAFCSFSGASGVLAPALLVRAVAMVVFSRDAKNARDGIRAGLYAGALAGVVQLSSGIGNQPTGATLYLAAGWACLGGLIEGALFALTRGVGERVLGHASRERLVALLDLSQPLLQRMILLAPGSFEHSRAMANLAEQAASAIGADALLTRVGAYYHDLGKSCEPKFFVENLEPGESSPHKGLTPQESARHIVRHVSEGLRLLRGGGIPEPVVEFAYTHHGSQLVEYFLKKERERVAGDGDSVDLEAFRYPGMKPGTKETAILMVVDSIEAASRTIDTPDRDRIEEMVRRIVFSKLGSGQLDESGLTLSELRIICARVVETLVHMNHHRIKYPWQEERAQQFGIEAKELSGNSVKVYPRVVGGKS